MKIDILQLNDPNLIGETLRAISFTGKGLGCYSTFELQPDFKPLETTSAEARRIARIIVGWYGDFRDLNGEANDELLEGVLEEGSFFSNGEIHLGWYWDGDGTLVFLQGDLAFVNDDCKKTNRWEVVVLQEELLQVNSRCGPLFTPEDIEAAVAKAPELAPWNFALGGLQLLWRLRSFEYLMHGLQDDLSRISLAAVRGDTETLRKILKPRIAEIRRVIMKYHRARDLPLLREAASFMERACPPLPVHAPPQPTESEAAL